MRRFLGMAVTAASMVGVGATSAQQFTTDDNVLRGIWEEGMDRSQTYVLAQALLDSIGPRLTGSPGIEAGNEWLVDRYESWGIAARNESYGRWMRWARGRTHVDLMEPRVRTLEATMLAWSPATTGTVRGEVVTLPLVRNQAEFTSWLATVPGKYVAISMPEPTCRPDDNWEEYATPESLERMREDRSAQQRAWSERVRATGHQGAALARALESAGAVGVLTSRWSRAWGVQKIFAAQTERVPMLDVSCEDYGLLFRLTENGQAPVIEVMAESEFLGEGPVFNTIAEIRGSELPDEYVMLSAHFDSWDAGSGATDNGTGTLTMLEAMRILKAVYPNPKRTILVGHWSGEEQGLNGSTGFAAAHPEVVEGLQALFNQDNGTGRVVRISAQGFTGAGAHFARWLSKMPSDLTGQIQFTFPGTPSGGGSDHASFVCKGAPAFSLGALGWSYGAYTWHTNRDTFDKVVFDDLKNNATLTAMLVYLAAEDPERVPRERRDVLTNPRTGQDVEWPSCRTVRTWEGYRR